MQLLTPEEIRSSLDKLIRARGEDYASISRLLGRNPAYIQQFIKRGTPRRLSEDDRQTLAAYFRVPEEQFGKPLLPVVWIPVVEMKDLPRIIPRLARQDA